MNKSLIMLVSVLAFGFLIVFILNSSTIMATYYKYSNDPNRIGIPCNVYWQQSVWGRSCVGNTTFGMWVCEYVGYGNYKWNYYTTNCAYGFKCGGSGQCYKTPQEPILKIGDFVVNSTKLRPGDTIHEGLFLYNLGTGDAYVKVCGLTSKYGITSSSNEICKSVYVEHTGGGNVVKFNLKVNDGDKYAIAVVYMGNKLIQVSSLPIEVIKPEISVSYEFSKYSGHPGEPVDVYYHVYNKNDAKGYFKAKVCIVPKYWNIGQISNDLYGDINEEFCGDVNGTVKYGYNTYHVVINVPKYGDFDSKYGFGSAWYGYGDYYIIGTTYEYGWNNYNTMYKSWKNVFTISNTTSNEISATKIYPSIKNNIYDKVFAILLIGGVIWYLMRLRKRR